MTRRNFLEIVENCAVAYCKEDVEASVLRNNHMNNLTGGEQISRKIYEAIVVDFVNFVGSYQSLDYGMTTKDLKQSREQQKQ